MSEQHPSKPLRAETPAQEYDELYRGGSDDRSYSGYDRPYWDSHCYPLCRAVLAEVQRLEGQRILEVGCGSGSFAHLLHDRTARQLRWSRDNPKRFMAMLGYKTLENLAGWIVFSGRRRG